MSILRSPETIKGQISHFKRTFPTSILTQSLKLETMTAREKKRKKRSIALKQTLNIAAGCFKAASII